MLNQVKGNKMTNTLLERLNKIIALKAEEAALLKVYFEAIENASYAERIAPELYPLARQRAYEAAKSVQEKRNEIIAARKVL
jgi:hypothetical protein